MDVVLRARNEQGIDTPLEEKDPSRFKCRKNEMVTYVENKKKKKNMMGF